MFGDKTLIPLQTCDFCGENRIWWWVFESIRDRSLGRMCVMVLVGGQRKMAAPLTVMDELGLIQQTCSLHNKTDITQSHNHL